MIRKWMLAGGVSVLLAILVACGTPEPPPPPTCNTLLCVSQPENRCLGDAAEMQITVTKAKKDNQPVEFSSGIIADDTNVGLGAILTLTDNSPSRKLSVAAHEAGAITVKQGDFEVIRSFTVAEVC